MEKVVHAGQPTLYKDEYCDDMLRFFMDWPQYVTVKKIVASAGRKVEIEEVRPNTPPTLNKYSIKLGVHRNTLKNWADQNEKFLCAYKICQMIQEEFTCDKGLLGEFNPAITKLMLVNHSEIKDKVTHDVSDDLKKTIGISITKEESDL